MLRAQNFKRSQELIFPVALLLLDEALHFCLASGISGICILNQKPFVSNWHNPKHDQIPTLNPFSTFEGNPFSWLLKAICPYKPQLGAKNNEPQSTCSRPWPLPLSQLLHHVQLPVRPTPPPKSNQLAIESTPAASNWIIFRIRVLDLNQGQGWYITYGSPNLPYVQSWPCFAHTKRSNP